MLYKNKEEVGGFANYFYWSSTEFDNFIAWEQDFSSGPQTNYNKNYNYYVRAVRAS